LFFIGGVLAFIALLSSLLLLWVLLDSGNPSGVMQSWHIGSLTYAQVTTSIYLKVSVSDFLTLFSSRTGRKPFWSTSPSPILLGAAAVALATSTILASTWPRSTPDHIPTVGLGLEQPYGLVPYIWLYCLFWWIVQDIGKVYAYKFIHKFNIFGVNNTGALVGPTGTGVHPHPLLIAEIEHPDLHAKTFLSTNGIVPTEKLEELKPFLPARFQTKTWRIAYSTHQHGTSMRTFYRTLKHAGPSIVVVTANTGCAFGCYAPASWSTAHKSYYGGPDAFVFELHPEVKVYPFSGKNYFTQLSSDDTISMGDGKTGYALWLSSNFSCGSSQACATFDSPPLGGPRDWVCNHVEVWTMPSHSGGKEH